MNQFYRAKDKEGVWHYGSCYSGFKTSEQEESGVIKKATYLVKTEGSELTNTLRSLHLEVDSSTVCTLSPFQDKNNKDIYEGDKIEFFGMRGIVTIELGCIGIVLSESINYDLLEEEVKSQTGNSYQGAHCDNFITLFELYWAFNDEDNCISAVQVMGNHWDADNPAYRG